MTDDKKNQWYTNKDLFELINQLQGEFRDFRGDNKELRLEMKETRRMIKQYNGLREEVGEARKEINDVKNEVETLQAQAKGRSSLWKDIRLWVSLAFSFCMLVVAIAAIIYN